MTTKAQPQLTEDFDFSIADGTNREYVDTYPRIQWGHGKKAMAKVGGISATGGLFIPEDQFPNFTAEGWQPDSFTAQNGDEIRGFSTTQGYLAVIRTKTWWAKYNDGSEGSQTHILCCVKGVEGLFSLQVSGVTKGKPMEDAFRDHRNQIVAMVNRSKPQGANGFEPYAMWFVVEPAEPEMYTSKVKADGKSEVTKPRLGIPAEVNLDYARTLWVGKDNYQKFTDLYRETKAWQTQFPQSRVTDEHEPDAPAFTGTPNNGEPMTKEQADHIAGLLEVKNVDMPELRELCLKATNGEIGNYQQLNKDEAAVVTDLLKAY